jgi:hypothetical protein
MMNSKSARIFFRLVHFAVLLLLAPSCRADGGSGGTAFVVHPSTRTVLSSTSFVSTVGVATTNIYPSSSFWKTPSSLAATKKKNRQPDEEDDTTRAKKNFHEKWQPYYVALVNYQQQHGHCNVSQEEDQLLYEWLEEQRTSYKNLQLYKKSKLTRTRAQALEMVVGAIPDELLDL